MPGYLKPFLKKTLASFVISLFLFSSALASDKTLVFADYSWDSVQVHNRVAAFIINELWGYECDFVPGGSAIMVQALMDGDIDVSMESWHQNMQEVYDKAIKSGKIIDIGHNLFKTEQGLYVPTYVIKGDKERGIDPMAPDLKTVADLKKYWKIFKDPEDPSKGRVYTGIAGWSLTPKTLRKLEAYGVMDTFNEFIAGSDAALSGSMMAAYKRGKAWVGYYWAPTWVLGQMDMTLLKEPAYDPEVWEKTGGCDYAPVDANKLLNHKLPERAPEVVAFLDKYKTTLEVNNEFLAQMKREGLDTQETAMWFLKNHEDVWTKWLEPAQVEAVKKALN